MLKAISPGAEPRLYAKSRNWRVDLDASNGFSNAFQSGSFALTHDSLLGSTVFAGETLHIW